MKKIIYAVVICTMAFAACTTPFKKAKDGSEYKVINNGDGRKVVNGNFMQLNVMAKYKDSILFNTVEDGMPQFGIYDTTSFQSPFKEAFKNIHEGDSVVIRISSDSILARGQTAPFLTKGQFIYQTYKVIKVFTTKEQMDSTQKTFAKGAQEKTFQKQFMLAEKDIAANKLQIDSDSKLIDAFMAKTNIKAGKTKWGTYIVIQNEGTGNTITSKDVVSVNYTGKTFDSSRVFDSNTDPKFKHVEPYQFAIGQLSGQNSVILGWTDALLQMKKGTKATIYIPSSLAYRKEGRMPEIKSNEILVFDIEVVDVTAMEELMAKQEAEQMKMQAAQQKVIDSIKAANPAAKAEMEKK
jgi:FKBP-type peptidyl-prolyl cis-trans isomerase